MWKHIMTLARQLSLNIVRTHMIGLERSITCSFLPSKLRHHVSKSPCGKYDKAAVLDHDTH